jgi:AAA ATPase domain
VSGEGWARHGVSPLFSPGPSVYGDAVGGVPGEASELIVGRDRELTRVTRLLDDVVAGLGRLVLCTGEAGIGRTRLAEEAAALAAARGVPVAWARAADPDSWQSRAYQERFAAEQLFPRSRPPGSPRRWRTPR